MRGISASKVLLCRAVYCIDALLGAFVNVLVFVHGPYLLDASTVHGIKVGNNYKSIKFTI